MADLPVSYENITVQDGLKSSAENKINYMNDVVGNLFGVVNKFRTDHRVLQELVRLLLHFKHQLAHLRQRGVTFDQASYETPQFGQDYDSCLARFRGLVEDHGRLLNFVTVCEQKQYSDLDQYRTLEEFSNGSIADDDLATQYLIKQIKPQLDFADHDNQEEAETYDTSTNDEDSSATEDESADDSMLPKTKKSNRRQSKTNGTTADSETGNGKADAIEVDFSSFRQSHIPDMQDYYKTVTLKSGRLKYQCKVPNCSHVEYRVASITSHIFKHFQYKPLHCSSCDYGTYAQRLMVKHCRNVHKYSNELIDFMKYFRANFNELTNDYLYQCQFKNCRFETKHSVILIGHLNWHMSQSPYKCAYCSLRSFDLKLIKRHVSRSHQKRGVRLKQQQRNCCIHSGCDFVSPKPGDIRPMIAHMRKKHSFRQKVPRNPRAKRTIDSKPKSQRKASDDSSQSEEEDETEEDEEEEEDETEEEDEDEEEEEADETRYLDENDNDAGFSASFCCSYKNCNFKSKSRTQVRAHEFRRHLKQKLKCSQDGCRQVFNTKTQLHEHMLEKHGISGHRCQVPGCGKAFISEQRLRIHLRDNHQEVYRSCDVCGKKFNSRANMRRHLRVNHQVGEYQCSVEGCDFTAPYRNQVHRHRQKDHPRSSKKCTFEGCNAVVKRHLFGIHMKRHLNIKPHTCSWPDCGKSFVQIKSLKDHARIHLNFKRFRCTWPDCGYASEQRTNVTKHIRIRHLKLPYTKKQERELNIDYDSLPQKPTDFIEVLPEDARVLL